MDKSKITKQNGNIAFEEEAHIYYDVTKPEQKFISVTTLIHSFTQPFDKEFWSAYKALEKLLPKEDWAIEKKSLLNTKKFDKVLLELHNITEDEFNKEQQAILDAWDMESRNSCERGTRIHADLENSFYKKKKDIDLSKYQIGGKFECIKDYNNLDLENGVYPEYLISRVSEDGKLRIAGQIDLLVKRGNKIIIGDWKTNKKIETKSFFNSKTKTSVKMKYPLNNLDDVNYWHYTLQLSTYAWMIQKKNPEFEIEDLVLVHFDHSDNMTVYHLPYLKDEVIRMLSFYKKESILAENKKKRQRIEY
jgi:ATP-dependent exoDNAse (exonuclease V) beta subunit